MCEPECRCPGVTTDGSAGKKNLASMLLKMYKITSITHSAWLWVHVHTLTHSHTHTHWGCVLFISRSLKQAPSIFPAKTDREK